MVRISKFKLRKDVLEKLSDLFFVVVGKKGKREEFRKVIIDLLSPAERIMIAKRIAIIYLLLKEIDYYNICNVLKVSPSTVAKFSLLMEKSQGIVPTFKNVLAKEEVREFLEEVFNTLFAPGVPGINWKAAWERKIDLKRRKAFGI
jgi:Trp operon repressor